MLFTMKDRTIDSEKKKQDRRHGSADDVLANDGNPSPTTVMRPPVGASKKGSPHRLRTTRFGAKKTCTTILNPLKSAETTTPSQLDKQASFCVGDFVQWKGADGDIPEGTIGEISKIYDDGDVEAQFPAKSFSSSAVSPRPFTFRAARLVKYHNPQMKENRRMKREELREKRRQETLKKSRDSLEMQDTIHRQSRSRQSQEDEVVGREEVSN